MELRLVSDHLLLHLLWSLPRHAMRNLRLQPTLVL
jgi:hypothetical protein